VAVKSVARFLVALLLLLACSSGHRVDTAFSELYGALPAQLRQTSEDRNESAHSARYEAKREPAEIAALVRSSLVADGFLLFDGSGLPDPSVTEPQPRATSLPSPTNLGPPPGPGPPSVDAIQIRGFRGKQDLGMMRSLYFGPAARPGWTVLVVSVALQD